MSFACECWDDIAIVRRFDVNKVYITTLWEYNFTNCAFTLILVYQTQVISLNEFYSMVWYLLAINSDAIAGGFNYDLLKESSNKLLDPIIRHIYIVIEPTLRFWL